MSQLIDILAQGLREADCLSFHIKGTKVSSVCQLFEPPGAVREGKVDDDSESRSQNNILTSPFIYSSEIKITLFYLMQC